MKKYFLIAITQTLFFVEKAFAQGPGGTVGGPQPPLSPSVSPLCPSYLNALCNTTISEIVDRIVNFLILIGGPIAAIMVLWGGFQIMTAAGDPEKFATGRKTILYAAIGFVVILAAKGVVGFVKSIFQ